jgi:hypothetical protein
MHELDLVQMNLVEQQWIMGQMMILQQYFEPQEGAPERIWTERHLDLSRPLLSFRQYGA